MAKQIFLCVLFSFSVLFSKGQDPVLNYFNANNTGNNILLTWEIKGGNTCIGINILRSTDGIVFQQIGEVEGVCGSVDFAVAYSFTDNNPEKNAWNYYKIELVNAGFSEISKAYFLSETASYAITQDYSAQQFTVIFRNPQSEEAILSIFTVDGRKLHSSTTYSDRFIIDYSTLKAGMLVFVIHRQNKSSISGRMYFY